MYDPTMNDEKSMHLGTQIYRSMRDYMDSDDNYRRKKYQSELKRLINIRNNFVRIPYENPLAQAIIKNETVERVRINNKGKFCSGAISPIKTKIKKRRLKQG